jgi:hypothetical protein
MSKEEPVTEKKTETVYRNNVDSEELDKMLDEEKLLNKALTWNKLNKTLKIQKLHQFSEKYGKEHKYGAKEVKQLKQFFSDALEKKKLQNIKEVVYDKTTREIIDVPGLHFHVTSRLFTLRVLDTKRVSTLKSLTPKRMIIEVTDDALKNNI